MADESPILLSPAFCGPVEYFSVIRHNPGNVFIDDSGNYVKQTWRNRCRILAESGPMDLSFPIVHDGTRSITAVKVDYSTPWIRRVEYALESAYSRSPFFEYYRDDLFAILDSRPETLWELDLALTNHLCAKLGVCTKLGRLQLCNFRDFRDKIHPKKPSEFQQRPYYQVFGSRHGFVQGLSVLDLLFNEGPESICYL